MFKESKQNSHLITSLPQVALYIAKMKIKMLMIRTIPIGIATEKIIGSGDNQQDVSLRYLSFICKTTAVGNATAAGNTK